MFLEDGALRRLVAISFSTRGRAPVISLSSAASSRRRRRSMPRSLTSGPNARGFGFPRPRQTPTAAALATSFRVRRAILVQVQQEAGAKGAKVTARPAAAGLLPGVSAGTTGVRLSRQIDDVAERLASTDAMEASATDTGGSYAVSRPVFPGIPSRRSAAWANRGGRCSNPALDRAAAGKGLLRGPDAVLAAIIEESGRRRLNRVLADNPRRLLDIRDVLPDVAERWEFHGDARDGLTHLIDEQIQSLLRPIVDLPSGGRIEIAETAAVVAIDVDTGAAMRGGPEDMALRVNLEAAGTWRAISACAARSSVMVTGFRAHAAPQGLVGGHAVGITPERDRRLLNSFAGHGFRLVERT